MHMAVRISTSVQALVVISRSCGELDQLQRQHLEIIFFFSFSHSSVGLGKTLPHLVNKLGSPAVKLNCRLEFTVDLEG